MLLVYRATFSLCLLSILFLLVPQLPRHSCAIMSAQSCQLQGLLTVPTPQAVGRLRGRSTLRLRTRLLFTSAGFVSWTWVASPCNGPTSAEEDVAVKTHLRKDTQTDAQTHPDAPVCTHTDTRTHTGTPVHTCRHKLRHTGTHPNTAVCTHKHTQTKTQTHRDRQPVTDINRHTHKHTDTYTIRFTYSDTYRHTQKHRHTYSQALSYTLPQFKHGGQGSFSRESSFS
jgi:hypothetical protein